jgi:hypothetical protein
MAEEPKSGKWQRFRQGVTDYRAEKKQAKVQNKSRAEEIKVDIEKVKTAKMDEQQRQQLLQQHKDDLDKLQPKRTFVKGIPGKSKAALFGAGAWLGSKFNSTNENRRNQEGIFHPDTWWKTKFTLYLLFAFAWHYLIIITLPYSPELKIILNMFFALLTYFWVVPEEEKSDKRIIELLIVVIGLYYSIERLGLIIANVAPASAGAFIHGWLLNPYLTPWWGFYALFVRVKNRTIFGVLPVMIILILYITAPLGGSIAFASGFGPYGGVFDKGITVDHTHLENFKDFLKRSVDFWEFIWDSIVRSIRGFKLFWYKQIDLATGGDYYTGRVENAEDEPLGVTIEDLQTADYEFEPDEKIAVYGIIKAHTLDDGIRIKPGCYLGYKREYEEKYVEGEVNIGGNGEYLVFDMDEQDIDCIIPQTTEVKALLKKSKSVSLTAEFNFETMAYLKTYFMYQDRLRSLQRQDLDPLGEFGIKDKDPTAVFTNGPVMLGMKTKKPPYGVAVADISGQTDNLLRVGVTVDNNYGWKGKIKKINQLILEVPEELEIVKSTCSHVFNDYADASNLEPCVNDYITHNSRPFIECAESQFQQNNDFFDKYDNQDLQNAKSDNGVKECVREVCAQEFAGYKGYELNTAFASKSLEDIENYKTFSCKFKVKDGGATQLLGTAPVSTRYLRARVRYDYEIERTTGVRVKKEYNQYGSGGIMEHTQTLFDDPQKAYETVGQKTWKSITNNHAGNIEPCTVIALLIEASGGQELFNQNGQQGLMSLPPKLSKKIADKLGETTYNLFDIDTNIRFGIQLLSDLKSGNVAYLGAEDGVIPTTESELNILFKEAVTKDEVKFDAIKPSVKSSCNNEKAYLCKDDPFYDKYNGYKLTINNLKDYCQKPETQILLENIKDASSLSELNPNFWSSMKLVKISKTVKDINSELEQNYEIKASAIFSEDKSKIQATLTLVKENKERFSKAFSLNKNDELNTIWYYGKDYPFVRARIKSVNFEASEIVIEVQDFKVTRKKVNLPYYSILTKSDIWVDSTTQNTLLSGFYNQPTNTIIFYDNTNEQICGIKLSQSSVCTNIPEIQVYRLNDVSSSSFEGYIEYNPLGNAVET